jgi:4'-phosphopantetheinyl transferase
MQTLWPQIIEPSELAAEEVHVWAVPLDAAHVPAAEQWAVLSTDERHRAEQFRMENAKRRFVIARAALRILLGRYTATPPEKIHFDYEPSGKPRLRGENVTSLQFNLAHSGELALVAITSGCEVGVDVEQLRAVHYRQEIAERYFHPREVAQLAAAAAAQEDAVFLHYWSGKEAILKALGTGVTQSLSFSVLGYSRTEAAWIDAPSSDIDRAARCWLQPLAPAEGYLGAVACIGVQRQPCCFTFA